MVERRKPIVTELALADALQRLVHLIEELRVDVGGRWMQGSASQVA